MRGNRLLGAVSVGACAALLVTEPAGAAAGDPEGFEISGEVDGLYPGAEATLPARVSNPQPFPIQVTSVAVAVGDAGPNCPAGVLEIRSVQTFAFVAAGASTTVPLDVHMDLGAPEACQGAAWPLELVGTAIAISGDAARPGLEARPSTTTGPGGLAFTGNTVAGLLALAAALVAGGLLGLRVGRGRRNEVNK